MSATSPLARGLRWRSPRWGRPPRIIPARAGFTAGCGLRRRATRIIPARAGFTRTATGRGGRWWDHPRSRGVYATRGQDIYEAGIIPARAGFTSTGPPPTRPSRDHPRSRGVYGVDTTTKVQKTGSSPLARGLRHPSGAPVLRNLGSSPLARGLRRQEPGRSGGERIIPARAGFTVGRDLLGGPGGDHPRSRGVYCRFRSPAPSSRGSSPLARGLPRRW